MTDEERYIAQGKARDAAKKLKAEIATLQAFFHDYADKLESAKGTLTRFISEPSAMCPDRRPIIDHVNDFQRELCAPGFFNSTAELLEKTGKLRKLEEQIRDF